MRFVWMVAVCAAALAAPLYNSIAPRLAGFTFFFWFQLALVPLSSLTIWLAYRDRRK